MPERRAAQQNCWPAACGELQATAKPRTVGRVSSGQFARSLRRSRVRAQYRARGPRPQVVAAGVLAGPLAGDRRRATNAAAQLPQSRGVVAQARWSTAMDGELGARGRAARAPGRSAGCRGARRRGTYWHTHRHSTCASLPGCWSPPAPVAAQVASRRAAATKEHSASGRKARQVRGGTACVCRVSACAHASTVMRAHSQ